MQIIDELEPVKRGGYGGAIGYLSYTGELDTAIHIRTVVVKDGVAHLQAGGGTVADASPEREFAESESKAHAVMRAIELAGQQSDWEQRVDFDRLRRHRLGRAKATLAASDLGALLLFDPNDLRYVTNTAIGTWERDKNIRFALLFREDDPILWDFGSAAKHHQLYCPWLP